MNDPLRRSAVSNLTLNFLQNHYRCMSGLKIGFTEKYVVKKLMGGEIWFLRLSCRRQKSQVNSILYFIPLDLENYLRGGGECKIPSPCSVFFPLLMRRHEVDFLIAYFTQEKKKVPFPILNTKLDRIWYIKYYTFTLKVDWNRS